LRTTRAGEQVSLIRPPAAIGEVTYRDEKAIAKECKRLRSLLDARKGKFMGSFMTAPSPGIIAAAMENKHYSSMSDYVAALTRALSVEYKEIIAHGFTLQIDAPDLAMERHTLFADKPLSDFLGFVRLIVRAINEAISRLPKEQMRLHVCWGNYNGPHECDVALEEIWPEIRKANVGAYVISLANPRHEHEVKVLSGKALPAEAALIAGVIDTTSNYVEHPEVVAGRIRRAVEAVGDPSRVIAGTDCGFETSAGFITIPEEVVWAKLRALRDGAALASSQLS
jgi:5-methyltetrahydropteroyltriglutamate--homocysteine methyltransferase